MGVKIVLGLACVRAGCKWTILSVKKFKLLWSEYTRRNWTNLLNLSRMPMSIFENKSLKFVMLCSALFVVVVILQSTGEESKICIEHQSFLQGNMYQLNIIKQMAKIKQYVRLLAVWLWSYILSIIQACFNCYEKMI